MGIFGKGLKGFDLFSRPFSFFIGNKKSKSTIFGGLLSVLIIAFSIYYFSYLMKLYFNGRVSPKITQNFQIESTMSSISIKDNFFFMEMMINGQPLKQYEKQVNKIFLTYTVSYEKYYQNGTYVEVLLPLSDCTDSNFQGYQCLEQFNLTENIDIYNSPVEQISSNYGIQISPCNPAIFSNCASPQEIYDLIFQSQNFFQLYTRIQQYDVNEKKFQNSYKSEYFYFDPFIMSYTRLGLILATTKLTEGLVFQQSYSSDTIYDYERLDTYFSQQNIEQRMEISGYAYLVLELNQVHNFIDIQYPMITEMLAQFMSIFNTMLFIGFLAKILAESHIIDDMNNMLLTEYYKKTAFTLIKSQEMQDFEKKHTMKKNKIQNLDENKKHLKQNKIDYNQNNNPETTYQCKQILSCQHKINQTNFSEQLSKFIKIGIFDRIINFICQIFGKTHKIQTKDYQNQDSIFYRNLMKQSLKRINIFEVYKDLIKMKMAIKLILTKEQYAAIQFCGTEILPEEKSKQEIIPETSINANQQSNEKQKENVSIEKPSEDNQNNEKILFSKTISPNNVQNLSNFKRNKKEQMNKKKKSEMHSSWLQKEEPKKIENNFFFEEEMQKIEELESPTKNYIDSRDEQIAKSPLGLQLNNNQSLLLSNHRSINQTMPYSIKSNLVSLNERDYVQNLKLVCDSQEIERNTQFLSERTTVHENQTGFQKSLYHEKEQLLLIPHLVQMDLIEQNELEQEKFLSQFLKKMQNHYKEDVSYIDKQIYQSLIINEQVSLQVLEGKKAILLNLDQKPSQEYGQSQFKRIYEIKKK